VTGHGWRLTVHRAAVAAGYGRPASAPSPGQFVVAIRTLSGRDFA
jgi:hypothetical protein